MSRTLLFEIGCEEIPSAPLYGAIASLKTLAGKRLAEERLAFDSIETLGSPRRLVLRVAGLAERQEDQHLRVKGPSVKAAFAEDGTPTQAAAGFARGQGVDVADLERVSDEKGEYVYAVVDRTGAATLEVLPEFLAELAAAIDWPKSMRWASGETRFVRPVRWLLALFGGDVVPVTFAGLEAGRTTRGHRFLHPEPIEVAGADEYDLAMKRGLVVCDQTERARLVREGIDSVAASLGGRAVVPEKTFAEVVNLVEYPTLAAGRFDEEFLDVPREVLETAMESHQRYFPVEEADSSLSNAFIVAHNGDPARTESIIAGHERVIRARLADAAFFFAEDLALSLEALVPRLEGIVFQEKLGTLAAKVARMESLAGALAELADADEATRASAVRAAHLSKTDLVSHVVIEFPSLQGVMGYHYALASGEGEGVARAIVEHYRPRFATDEIPASAAGRLVSIADKLDTMVGVFGIGMAPTGSADPYALRRGALGILGIVLAGPEFGLDEAIALALEGYRETHDFDAEAVGAAVKGFIVGRLEGVLKERGHAYDTVAAVLAVAGDDPADALRRCEALTTFRAGTDAMEDLSVAFTRARNLCKPELGTVADPGLMGASEAALADALAEAEQATGISYAARDYDAVLGVLAALRAPIDTFFADVLVMDPDERLRDNRLRLLNRFVELFARFADLGLMAQ